VVDQIIYAAWAERLENQVVQSSARSPVEVMGVVKNIYGVDILDAQSDIDGGVKHLDFGAPMSASSESCFGRVLSRR
jgi:hypothetical protein